MGIRIHIIRVINSVIGLRITYHQSSAVNSRWKFLTLAWYSLKQVYQLEGSFQDPPTHIAERVWQIEPAFPSTVMSTSRNVVIWLAYRNCNNRKHFAATSGIVLVFYQQCHMMLLVRSILSLASSECAFLPSACHHHAIWLDIPDAGNEA